MVLGVVGVGSVWNASFPPNRRGVKGFPLKQLWNLGLTKQISSTSLFGSSSQFCFSGGNLTIYS